MKNYLFAAAVLLSAACNSGETTTTSRIIEPVSTIFEYTPAPGQFINEPLSGYTNVTTPEAACAYAANRFKAGFYVSLGGWGGYIVAGFSTPVPEAGGDELLITGNSFDNSSEPGIVYVMQDENGNGRPDDTWYELRGSEYDSPATIRGYEVTYTRPAGEKQEVAWHDNQNGSGTIGRIDEHQQGNYYPAWIEADEHTFSGTRLPDNLSRKVVDKVESWVTTPFAWGYADNYSASDLRKQYNVLSIKNAVTAQGQPAQLTQVDFIKVQTGVNAWAPIIGEISTDVCGIACYRTLKK